MPGWRAGQREGQAVLEEKFLPWLLIQLGAEWRELGAEWRGLGAGWRGLGAGWRGQGLG